MYNVGTTFLINSKEEYWWLMRHLEAQWCYWNSGQSATHFNYNSDYTSQRSVCIIANGNISCGTSGDISIQVSSLMYHKRPSIFKSKLSIPKSVNGYKVSPEAIEIIRNSGW